MRWLYAVVCVCCLVSLRLPSTSTAQGFFKNAVPTFPEVHIALEKPTIVFDHTGQALIQLQVTIPPEHHGYLDKGEEGFYIPLTFAFKAFEERGARVTEVSRPPGVRDDQVQATVLRNTGQFVFGVATAAPSQFSDQTLLVLLRHQICNDLTRVCYPPKEVVIPLAFAPSTAAIIPQQSPAVAPSLTLNERMSALFQRFRGHLLLTLAVVFIAGILASATPCVYPMLPITSAILLARGAGSRQRGRVHALVYCSGMVVFYALLGLFASTTGTALSAIMTSAWVNLGFAIIFAYLGLSMLGVVDFQFFTALISELDVASSRWQGVSGTFLMGITAGLIVSPCVGPISGAILLDISQQAASGAMGSGFPETALRGAGFMASFGGGLGVPFVIVAFLSHRLPQSGPWVGRIKWLLGLPILYVAYLYYSKGMDTAAVPSNVAQAILLGVLAIGGAVYAGAFHTMDKEPSPFMLLRRALGIILLIIGIHFLYNGLGQSNLLLSTSRSVPQQALLQRTALSAVTPALAVETIGNLTWGRDFSQAQQRANLERQPLFVDFFATWCANCKAFQQLAIKNPQLNTALQQAVLVKIYDTDEVFSHLQQDPQFPELRGIGGQPLLPLFAIYSPDGVLRWKGQDYQAVSTMVTQLAHAKSGTP